ncbi:MAG: hypothetical protein Q8R36_05645 [bacterium]|nr:hypothetical protein [bacterium]
MKNIFHENLIKEEIITFTYRGDKFSSNEIELESLISELKGIEVLIKETVEFYRKKRNLSGEEVSFEIYVKVEDGSIKEVIKIVKKNAVTFTLIGTFVMPFLQSGFDYYLNNNETNNPEVVDALETNKKIRKSFENILTPITGDDNVVTIHNGDNVYNINFEQKKKIIEGIKRHEELLSDKEVVKEEDLMGIVSISKLYDVSPFSFRVSETVQDIPMFFSDIEFNLEDRQDFLGRELVIKADVTYKEGRRISLMVKEYKPVEHLFEI